MEAEEAALAALNPGEGPPVSGVASPTKGPCVSNSEQLEGFHGDADFRALVQPPSCLISGRGQSTCGGSTLLSEHDVLGLV